MRELGWQVGSGREACRVSHGTEMIGQFAGGDGEETQREKGTMDSMSGDAGYCWMDSCSVFLFSVALCPVAVHCHLYRSVSSGDYLCCKVHAVAYRGCRH